MAQFHVGQVLPAVQVTARNYATDSNNRIHSDEVASRYGFSGGLVPGVGDYAYMTQAVVASLGREWLTEGFMSARFLKPVYHGEAVTVRCVVKGTDPMQFELELKKGGTVCAVGAAGLGQGQPHPTPQDYPARPMPEPGRRWRVEDGSPPEGATLGSLEITLDLSDLARTYPERVCDPLPVYRGAGAVCHPSFVLDQANQILSANVDLGPWIHTASEVQHYSLARDGERLSLRGKVAERSQKRGHELAVLDLALFAGETRPVARVRHSAIIRLAG